MPEENAAPIVIRGGNRFANGATRLREPNVVSYTKPDLKKKRHIVSLARSDVMIAAVQVFQPGAGETSLHSHPNMDGLWFVLHGRARFYTRNDAVVAELGPQEAVLIPRDCSYWFENSGDDDLEILQVEGLTRPGDAVEAHFYSPLDRDAGDEIAYTYLGGGREDRS